MAEDNKAKTTDKPEVGVEYGAVGTDLFSGYVDVDYNAEWRTLHNKCKTVATMMNDGAVSGVINALTSPILSSKAVITPSSEDEVDKKNADFINECLFDNIDFQSFLVEVTSYFAYGFSVFEKNFTVKDGKIVWKEFSFREQSKIEKWNIGDGEWENGHPKGITQSLIGTDGSGDKMMAEIPWCKIMRFTKDQTGNNFEGVSVLRRAYPHWYYKDLLYKVGAMAAERFGVGVPWAKYKSSADANAAKNMNKGLSGIRSNAQGYLSFSSNVVEEWGIKTPDGSGQNSIIFDLIKHHDEKIYGSIMGLFLNLAGGSGSNALSKDQSSFFLRSMQKEADYISGIINKAIEELCDANNLNVENGYPKLSFSELGEKSANDYADAISTAKNAGLLGNWSEKDINKVRMQIGLDEMEGEIPEQPEEQDIKNDEEVEQSAKKKVPSFATYSDTPKSEKVRVTQRERVFTRNISNFENYLSSEYSNIEKIVSDEEKSLNSSIINKYKTLDTERVDGVQKIAYTSKNKNIFNDVRQEINKTKESLTKSLINSDIQNRLFSKARKFAEDTVEQDEVLLKSQEKKFANIKINEAQFLAFEKGYISNLKGVLFNNPRQYTEKVDLHEGSGVSISLAISEIDKSKFNRRDLVLSTITHPRGAFNGILKDANEQRGINHYKVTATPKTVKHTIENRPSGMTAKFLFLIFTAAMLVEEANKETEGGNPDVMNGLNLHHNAQIYFYPISDSVLEEEKEIAEKQREEFLGFIKAQKIDEE